MGRGLYRSLRNTGPGESDRLPNFSLPGNVWRYAFALLLAIGLGRLWLMPLPSSFWVDEMGTAFVVHYGAQHWSFAVAPQVPASLYYVLPRWSERLFGFSEWSYRLPSIVAMGVALLLTARLAARLVHPRAAWFAVFACLSLRGINYEACNARPYALGACVELASVFFLMRWLDATSVRAAWGNAVVFVVAASLLWRVHLVFWPLYVVLAMYAVVRLVSKDTRVGWVAAGLGFAVVGVALVPVLLEGIELMRHAGSHVVAALPRLRDLRRALKISFAGYSGVGAWLLERLFRWRMPIVKPAWPARALIAQLWLVQPVCLFAFSWLSGDSLFIDRYLAVALPGVALAVTLAVGYFVPASCWRPVTLLFAIGVLAATMNWREVWPAHHNSDWRTAAKRVNALGLTAETPVICPSPFIEAQPPVWRPEYPLPSFLYSYLTVYPVGGRIYRFPFRDSPEAEQYAVSLVHGELGRSGRFVLYGGDANVRTWRKWFGMRPEFLMWGSRRLGRFGDVDAVVFERGR